MGKLSASNVYPADQRRNFRSVHVDVGDGRTEMRAMKRPEGRIVEQFVDKQGHVVWLQLLQFGTNHDATEADRRRAVLHRDGFLEHGRCPILGGTWRKPAFEADFDAMPAELRTRACTDDPTVHRVVGSGKSKRTLERASCPHVEWLIAYRRDQEAQAQALRATQIETVATIEKQKLSIAEQALVEQRETNAAILALAKQSIANTQQIAAAPAMPAPTKEPKPKTTTQPANPPPPPPKQGDKPEGSGE